MTETPVAKEYPLYDFEHDNLLSERRKAACRVEYGDMTLEDVDKLFDGAFQYDKITGEIISKKPRSHSELLYLSVRRNYDLLERIKSLEEYVNEISNTVMKMKDDMERK